MNISAPVETAATFLELLRQTERERDELDDVVSDSPVPPEAAAAWDLTDNVLLVANATWVGRLIDADMLATIEAYLKETPLQVRRNAFAGTVSLVTPGVLSGLKQKVLTEQRASEEGSEGRFSTVAPPTYKALVREGIVDWTVRTAADEGYELRSCTQCGKWFEPQLKARGRFCSPKCRKEFNNLRSSGRDDLTTFKCGGCLEKRPMDEFAGLRFDSAAAGSASPLRMGPYSSWNKTLCCAECVRTKHPEWRRYIAPMESLSERVTA